MRKKLTPIFRQISDVATPKSVKKMAEMTVCAASQRLSKAYSGGFVGGGGGVRGEVWGAHLAFNGAPTHPSIYRASLSNANGVFRGRVQPELPTSLAHRRGYLPGERCFALSWTK